MEIIQEFFSKLYHFTDPIKWGGYTVLFIIVTLTLILSVAAILRDIVGYWIGCHAGSKIFSREDSLPSHRKHLVCAQEFYNKYGAKTIVIELQKSRVEKSK